MNFFKVLFLFSVVTSFQFCKQNQMINLVRLSQTIEKNFEYEFSVFDMSIRRRRHHYANIQENVIGFYEKMSGRLENVLEDILVLPKVKYGNVQNLISVMIELMKDEIQKSEPIRANQELSKKTKNHRSKNYNQDIINERVFILLNKIILTFKSVNIQCIF